MTTAGENHTVVGKHEVTGHLEAWARDQLAGGRAPSTILLWRRYLTRWAATIPDDGPVTAAQIRAWLAWPDWSPNTRKSAVGAVRSWLRWAHRNGWECVPAPDVIEVPRVSPGVPRPASDEVITHALRTASPRDALAIRLGAELGLRRAEIARVATTDLIGTRLVVHGKGRKPRLVPVPPDLVAMIETRPAGQLFPGRVDGHMSADRIGRRIRRALGAATAHQLRHRYGTECYRATGDLITLSRAMGHATIATTQVYTEPSSDAMDRLAAAAAAGLLLDKLPVRGLDRHPVLSGH